MKRSFLLWACLCQALCLPLILADPDSRANGGSKRARVIVVHEANATAAFNPQTNKVLPMINRGLTNLTGKPNPTEAWLSLVNTQETIGIKVCSGPGPVSGTRRVVVDGVVRGLLASGIPARQIVVWDRRLADLRESGYFELAARHGIRVAGSAEAGYDEKTFYETALLGQLVWGDSEFGKKEAGVGRKSFVSKLVTQQITKIISVTPLLNHNLAGVSGHLWGLALGSVDNTLRFETDANRLNEAVPEIVALPSLGDRVVLNVTDALLGQYEGEETQLLHYSTPLNQLWFSRDPVALDVLAVRELDRLRESARASLTGTNLVLYENAALLEIGVSDERRIDVVRVP